MPPLTPYSLRCEHLAHVRGLNTTRPRFSWALSGAGRDRRQTAYQILIGKDEAAVLRGEASLWDSGKRAGDSNLLVEYDGPELASGQLLFWTVRVWDEADRVSPAAPAATIHTGLLQVSEWKAKWIGRREPVPGESPNFYRPVKYDPAETYNARAVEYLRRSFRIDKPVKTAFVYASALGVYKLRLNGQAVGNEELAPGWTDYHKRVEYQVFDVASQLRAGANVLGAMVGEGWYCGRVGLTLKRQGAHYGPRQLFICQLEITYEDGSRDVIVSDESWQGRTGPIVFSDLLLGERYDADREIDGWDRPGGEHQQFGPVEFPDPGFNPPELNAARCEPIRRHEQIAGRFLHRLASGALIYDFGQNLVGFTRLEASRAVPGGSYVMRHGEALEQDGTLYTKNLRSALQQDIYNAATHEPFSYEPSFTLHGYRYVELTGPDLDPQNIVLTAIVVHTALAPSGTFESGVELVNRLHHNIVWSTKGNFVSVPTDCPQRDERLGWLCDFQVFQKTASCSFDIAAFTAKWLIDVLDAQQGDGAFTDVAPSRPHQAHRFSPPKGAPGWGDAGILMPYQQYCEYGDKRLLEQFYPAMQAFMAYVNRHNPHGLRTEALNRNYGDWFSLGTKTDNVLVAQAYWAHDAAIMAKVARVLGRESDAADYRQLHDALKERFEAEFIRADGTIGTDTQTSYLLPLAFQLLSPERAKQAATHLVRTIEDAGRALTTGFLGLRHLLPVLSGIGRSDLAYDLLLKESMPSWLYAIKHADATTIWERWDFFDLEKGLVDDPRRSSLNHYAFGAVGEWLFAQAAGIELDETQPAFAHVILKPMPSARLGRVRAAHEAHLGRIESQWQVRGSRVEYECEIPPNGRGTLIAETDELLEDGRPAECERLPDGRLARQLGSGRYTFSWLLRSQSEARLPHGALQ